VFKPAGLRVITRKERLITFISSVWWTGIMGRLRIFKMRKQRSINAKRLTKQFLMSLRAGGYLVGNVCDNHYRPAFAERVAPRSKREEQWQRIKEVRAQGRVCDLFKDRERFKRLASRKLQSAKRHGYLHSM
jgi:hypothetical protein